MPTLPTGTVSFLFTDIQGSTDLLHALGDRAYGEVLLEHQRLLRKAFAAHEGTEVDTQGDAFFIAFPRAWNAVTAAVTAQQVLTAHAWPTGVAVLVRMGIHTGEPTLVGGQRYVGLDVHRAARIAATGYGGQVLLSERAHAMALGHIPEGVAVRDLGEHRLKDLPRPEHIFQLVMPGLPADFPPLRSLEVLVTNLPALQLTSFVGRERELAAVKEHLAETRMLSLLGPGGTGKTRLALQAGSDLLERFSRGVWLAELAPHSDPELVVQTVATVFNVREVPGRPLRDSLVDYLRPREVLLILDNCEHLREPAALLASALLRDCPHLRILATSREPLGVAGEVVYRVPPLSRADPATVRTAVDLRQYEAARLFVERAVLSNPHFALSDANAPAVARVVHRLDGIPLAIELAAARTKVLSVDQIAARLDDRFRLLTTGARAGLRHHQTLQAALDWSHDLLSEQERALFRRLAVFAGGFTLEAAEAICSGEGVDTLDVLDTVARLVDKSLLVAEEMPGDVRYRMLETIRAYSREKLVAAGEEAAVRGRHLQWHLALAEEAEPYVRGPEQVTWLDRLELDHDDLRAALDWSATSPDYAEAGLRLAGALHRFWVLRGHFREGRRLLEEALSRADAAPPALRAKAMYGAGVLASVQGDYAWSEVQGRQGLALQRGLGDGEGGALSLALLGTIARNRGNLAESASLLEEGLTLARDAAPQWTLAEVLRGLGLTSRSQRDNRRAKSLLEESLALWRTVGDKWGLAYCLTHLGYLARFEGDYARAEELLEESLVLGKELGERSHTAATLDSLGVLATARGDFAHAVSQLEESLALSRELGNKRQIGAAIGNLAMATYRQGDFGRATTLLEEGLALYRDLGDRSNIAAALGLMGSMAFHQGSPERAADLYVEALALHKEIGDKLGVAECLEGLAGAAAATGRPERAALLLGAAHALRQAIATPIPASDQADYDRIVAAVRAVLPEEAFLASWTRGESMPLAEVFVLFGPPEYPPVGGR